MRLRKDHHLLITISIDDVTFVYCREDKQDSRVIMGQVLKALVSGEVSLSGEVKVDRKKLQKLRDDLFKAERSKQKAEQKLAKQAEEAQQEPAKQAEAQQEPAKQAEAKGPVQNEGPVQQELAEQAEPARKKACLVKPTEQAEPSSQQPAESQFASFDSFMGGDLNF